MEKSFDEAVYGLQDVLRKMALEQCSQGNPEYVHWLVSEERRLHGLVRGVEMRGMVPRRRK